MKNNTTLIPLCGDSPFFHATTEKNYSSINARTFSNKLRDFNPVQNFKFAWEKASEYLEKIAENKDFKKLKKAALKVASNDLGFNKENQKPEIGLDEKIRNETRKSLKSSLPKPKPKF